MRFIANTSGMKKLLVFFIVISIICVFWLCNENCNNCKYGYGHAIDKVVAKSVNKSFDINIDAHQDISVLRKNINKSPRICQLDVINKIMGMGFSLKEALCYVYPNLEKEVDGICESLLVLPQEPCVIADNNNCKIIFKNAKYGTKVDKNALFYDFYENIKNNTEINIKMCEIAPIKTLERLQKDYILVSDFKTSFKNSSESRKHNIKKACSTLNGQFIKSGAVFSFNQAVGPRSMENGYMEAKIIKDGLYADGYGGGVCQVSSTLYNACILAGLEIDEVHNHSLPTSYVDPCFDAMVNTGSADLKIKNNTSGDFLIACSTLNDECRVCVYGIKPSYTIVTRYDKYEHLPAGEDFLETNVSKYNKENLKEGLNRISYATDGYRAKGYLDYYKDGVLVKSRLIRDDTYKPRKGIVLFVERVETE